MTKTLTIYRQYIQKDAVLGENALLFIGLGVEYAMVRML